MNKCDMLLLWEKMFEISFGHLEVGHNAKAIYDLSPWIRFVAAIIGEMLSLHRRYIRSKNPSDPTIELQLAVLEAS